MNDKLEKDEYDDNSFIADVDENIKLLAGTDDVDGPSNKFMAGATYLKGENPIALFSIRDLNTLDDAQFEAEKLYHALKAYIR